MRLSLCSRGSVSSGGPGRWLVRLEPTERTPGGPRISSGSTCPHPPPAADQQETNDKRSGEKNS